MVSCLFVRCVEAADREGKTPLIYAGFQGHLAAVQWLLAVGVNPNQEDADGVTALHWAALGGFLDVVTALLAAGANPNATERTEERSTPLDYAAVNSHHDVVAVLVR